MKVKITRRQFLKNTAVSAVGVSAMGILGACQNVDSGPTAESTESSMAATAEQETTATAQPQEIQSQGQEPQAPAGGDRTWGGILNPQEDFTSYTTDYSAIFSPLTIGGVTLPNRIVKSCAGSEMQKNTERPDKTMLAYYEQFCKGGVGMICFEPSTLIPGPSAAAEGIDAASLDFTSDANIPAHQEVSDLIHGYGIPVIAQMLDMVMATGGSSTTNEFLRLEMSFGGGKMQSTEDVKKEIQYFIDGALRYQKAGFDGVELNCSCNHYFSTFLSRYANHERTDEYSGETLENRARVVTEIIEGIRQKAGEDFIIQVLYSGVEENVHELGNNSLCTTLEEACEFARLFEKAGASCLHIRSEAYGHHSGGFMPDMFHAYEHGDTGYGSVIDFDRHFGGNVIGKYDGAAALLNVASAIKSCVTIPVGVVGSMDPRLAPDLLNQAIADGKIDYILMTRPLMADMSLPKKLKEGRRDEVAPCARCMTCFSAILSFGTPMYCRVNGALTRAYGEDMPEGYDPVPAETKKKVMVIGGGPAGMEAARIAAQRGHDVTLYEKSGQLGGKLEAVQAVKGSHERILDHRNFLIRQLEVNGVKVELNQEVDAQKVKEEAPDIAIVAVGAGKEAQDIPGADSEGVISTQEFLDMVKEGQTPEGYHFVIAGGQFQACDIAVYLTKMGKKVTILNPGAEKELYQNAPAWPKAMGTYWLQAKGVKVYHNVDIQKIEGDGITFETDYSLTAIEPYDKIILALPQEPDRRLFDSLVAECSEVYAAGDCYSPGTIANGIARANIVARKAGQGAEGNSGQLKDNQYRASAVGIGDVTVTITVEDGRITEAFVNTSNETEGIGRHLGEVFAEQIEEKGEIDSVSGATITSQAVQSALSQCKKEAGI